QQKKGRVVNVIGNDGVKVSYWEIAPGAANAAGQNLTLSLASQYGKDNISFACVNPGPVRTERWSGLVQAMARDMNLSFEEADKLAPASIPLGRIAESEEVANLVVPRLRSRLLRQWHDDRDRRRSGKAAHGQAARPLSGIASRGSYREISEPRHDLGREKLHRAKPFLP